MRASRPASSAVDPMAGVVADLVVTLQSEPEPETVMRISETLRPW